MTPFAALSPVSVTAQAEADLALAREMAGHFPVCAGELEIVPLGSGLINTTFAVAAGGGEFVLQRINPLVFPDPPRIMDNLARLQRAALDAGIDAPRLPRFYEAAPDQLQARDRHGHDWRLLERIPDAMPLPTVADSAQATGIGFLLGRFHRFGAALAVDDYHVTLPQSHDTASHRAALDTALDAGWGGADARVAALIDQIHARDPVMGCLREALETGRLRKTVIHGDPKRDNVLFDRAQREALCLIDLDTVQPGLILHDIGDCLRSCCNRVGESATAAQVRFDAELAEALLRGYAEAAPGLLGAPECELLFDAIRLIPLELGMRFLADHLRGDRYFRVSFRGENLNKAEAQLALVADIERQETRLRALSGALA